MLTFAIILVSVFGLILGSNEVRKIRERKEDREEAEAILSKMERDGTSAEYIEQFKQTYLN